MNFLQIKETCIYVTDLNRTRQFYGEKLGLKQIALVEDRHVFFQAGSSVLLCFIASATEKDNKLPRHGAHGICHLAFEVDPRQYHEIKNEIVAKGISIEHEQGWENGKLSFYFRDPDKHLLEIIQKGVWEGKH